MSWINKSKISQDLTRALIVTPDGFQILVGSNEDEILLYQEVTTRWLEKTKNSDGSWQNKTKTVS